MKKIALTGGIASGKSSIQKYLVEKQVPVIDADEVTHDLYANDAELHRQIRDTFGDTVFNVDQSVNRDKLGDVVFKEPLKLKQLSSWIHPKVRQKMTDFFEAQEKAVSRL